MNKYDSYKEVELSWIDFLPKHWEIKKISRIFEIRKEKNYPIKTKEVLSLSAKYGVSLYSNKKEKGGNKPKEDLTSYNLCYPNDILVNCMNIVSGAVGISNYFGAVSPVYYPLVNLNTKGNYTRYMEYVFRNYSFQRSLVGLGKGIQMSESDDGRLFTVRMRISWDMLKIQEIPVPPYHEQKQIVDYLDWKITEIDRLILTEKEKLKELEKYRQKYIDDTFRNIESNRCVSLSKMGNFIKGGGFSRENLTKSCNKAILYGDIYTKYNYWFEDCINTIDDKAFASARHIKGNVVLFTGSGETKEDIGKTVAYVGNSSIALGGDIVAYIPNEKFNAKYISYFCNSSNIKSFKYIESTGEIIVHITVGVIKNIKVPFINKEEQDIIVEKLDEFMRNYEKLVSIINDVIEKFSLLKQSLISEVVTGQIDVRNIVVPEYEKVNVIEDTKEMESEEDGS